MRLQLETSRHSYRKTGTRQNFCAGPGPIRVEKTGLDGSGVTVSCTVVRGITSWKYYVRRRTLMHAKYKSSAAAEMVTQCCTTRICGSRSLHSVSIENPYVIDFLLMNSTGFHPISQHFQHIVDYYCNFRCGLMVQFSPSTVGCFCCVRGERLNSPWS